MSGAYWDPGERSNTRFKCSFEQNSVRYVSTQKTTFVGHHSSIGQSQIPAETKNNPREGFAVP